MQQLPETPTEVVRFLVGPLGIDTEDVNELFRILSVERRRLVIVRVFVLPPFDSTDANKLSHQIAGVENEEDPEVVASNDRRAVYSGLIQNHLPALADAQIISYDRRSRRVSRGPATHVAAVVIVMTIVILWLLGRPDVG